MALQPGSLAHERLLKGLSSFYPSAGIPAARLCAARPAYNFDSCMFAVRFITCIRESVCSRERNNNEQAWRFSLSLVFFPF